MNLGTQHMQTVEWCEIGLPRNTTTKMCQKKTRLWCSNGHICYLWLTLPVPWILLFVRNLRSGILQKKLMWDHWILCLFLKRQFLKLDVPLEGIWETLNPLRRQRRLQRVYKISCECGEVYIGRTGTALTVRHRNTRGYLK